MLCALLAATAVSTSSLLAATTVVGSRSFGPTTASIGDTLERAYTVYAQLPTTTTEAVAAGWVPTLEPDGSHPCKPGLGLAWSEKKGGVHNPVTLFFTAFGQASGVGVTIYGEPKTSLIKAGYFVPILGRTSQYFLSVSFRSQPNSCSQRALPAPLGTMLVVNAGPGGIKQILPLTANDALSQGWVRGSCFAGMGSHWFRDLSAAGKLSWEASNLLPVVTMYDEESDAARGNINAFFFASSVVQQSVLPPNSNEWDAVPLPNLLMCKNFCSNECTFHDTSFFSTMHIYLSSNRPKVTCTGGCSIGCCASRQPLELQ